MATGRRSSKAFTELRTRLTAGSLTKKDIALLDEMVVSYIEVFKTLEQAKTKVGGKTLIAHLPFGFDIVK